MRKIITHFKVVLTLLSTSNRICPADTVAILYGPVNSTTGLVRKKPSPDLLCGYLSVPLKYTDTGGDASYEKKSQVKLALTKLPAKQHKEYPDNKWWSRVTSINPYINFDWPVTIFVSHGILLDLILEASDRSTPTINCRQSDTETQET